MGYGKVYVVISKKCPFCYRDSYSAYDDPDWECPYCGKKMGSNTQSTNGGTDKQTCLVADTGKIIDFANIKEQLRVIRRQKINAGSTASYKKGKI